MFNPCVILMSGGPDSALLLQRHHEMCAAAVWVDYGQPARERERSAAFAIAKRFGVQLVECSVAGMAPAMGAVGSPSVVPARNVILISLAASVAIREGARHVLIGCCQDDHSDYADCRPPFIQAASRAMAWLGVSVEAPLAYTRKASILEQLDDEALALSVFCYRADGPCGECNSCRSRMEVT